MHGKRKFRATTIEEYINNRKCNNNNNFLLKLINNNKEIGVFFILSNKIMINKNKSTKNPFKKKILNNREDKNFVSNMSHKRRKPP